MNKEKLCEEIRKQTAELTESEFMQEIYEWLTDLLLASYDSPYLQYNWLDREQLKNVMDRLKGKI